MPKLLLSLPDVGEIVRDLTEPTLTVGRTGENTLQIDDISVSTHHAELTRQGADYVLKDLHSTNGTAVNGEPFTGEHHLKPGDIIRFGKVDAVYQTDTAAAAPPPPKEQSTPAVAAAATSSQRPEGFASTSPFKKKKTEADSTKGIVLGLFVLACIAFAASVVATLFG